MSEKPKHKRITELPQDVEIQWLIGTSFGAIFLVMGAMATTDRQLIFNVAVAYQIAFQMVYGWYMNKHYVFVGSEDAHLN